MGFATRETYTGDGLTTDWVFDIPYIKTSDVYVYDNGMLTAGTVTFPSAGMIRVVPAIASGNELSIRRITDRSLTAFLPSIASTPSTADLNRILIRSQYICQEAGDAAIDGSITLLTNSLFDAGGRRLTNLADGVDATDAVTIQQAQSLAGGGFLPSFAGKALNFLRCNSTAASLEFVTPAQTATAIGAITGVTSAAGNTLLSVTDPTTKAVTLTPEIALAADVLKGTDASLIVTPGSASATWRKGNDLASASTLQLPTGSVAGGYFNVTGTTGITVLNQASNLLTGRRVQLTFTGILTITHNATSLALPGAANITTAAGDTAAFVCVDSTNNYWKCVDYTKAGVPPGGGGILTKRAVVTTAVVANGTPSIAHGLGVKPTSFECFLVNTTAEAGYSVGDEIPINPSTYFASIWRGQSIKADATNVNIYFSNAGGSGVYVLLDLSSRAGTALTDANWNLKVVVYA